MTKAFITTSRAHLKILGVQKLCLAYLPNAKLQIDQSISFIERANRDIQWFSRSMINYKPFQGWAFNATYQTFKGNEVDFITSASFNNNLNVYQPEDPNTLMTLDPYANISLGVSKIFPSE